MDKNRFIDAGIGVDIGGSLIKLVYFRPLNPVELPKYVLKDSSDLPLKGESHLSIKSDVLGGVLRFVKIPIEKIHEFVEFVKGNNVHELYASNNNVNVTGGGAFKFESLIKNELNLNMNKLDEMQMLVNGLIFLLENAQNEVFTYNKETQSQEFVNIQPNSYPYMLVNIGSGVSILKINSKDHFERVSGSSIGGGTFWGLTKLLTKVENFNKVESLSKIGNYKNVDLLVGDIYGMDYKGFGLDASVLVSSFGKVGIQNDFDEEKKQQINDADIIQSLLFMISNNIAQIAYLNAQMHNVSTVFFSGGFIQGNKYILQCLTFGIKFWSKGEMKPLFLVHDGYLGALGSLLHKNKS